MDERHVVVVGAGLAGVTAARELHDAGIDVQVWEARDRVGGRTWTSELDGAAIDLGAQWLGPEQQRMHALADRFDLARFPTHRDGDSLVVDGDDVSTYGGTVPLLGPVQLARMAAALLQLRVMARTAERGPVQPLAVAGDVVVVHGRRRQRPSCHRCGDPGHLRRGARARLGRVGRGLRGHRVRARHVVVAVPPLLLADIEHVPALPEPLRATLGAIEMGSTTKVFVAYGEAFWRDGGLRGEAVLTEGPVLAAIG